MIFIDLSMLGVFTFYMTSPEAISLMANDYLFYGIILIFNFFIFSFCIYVTYSFCFYVKDARDGEYGDSISLVSRIAFFFFFVLISFGKTFLCEPSSFLLNVGEFILSLV